MDTITCSDVRRKLTETMENVCDNHSPVIVTRKRSPPVVMMSLEDFSAMEVKANLSRGPEEERALCEINLIRFRLIPHQGRWHVLSSPNRALPFAPGES